MVSVQTWFANVTRTVVPLMSPSSSGSGLGLQPTMLNASAVVVATARNRTTGDVCFMRTPFPGDCSVAPIRDAPLRLLLASMLSRKS